MRAPTDRGLARDLIDVRAAAERWSQAELETLGRRHARDTFDLDDLQARLTGIGWIDDAEFAAYGLDAQSTAELRRWAQSWADERAVAWCCLRQADQFSAWVPGSRPARGWGRKASKSLRISATVNRMVLVVSCPRPATTARDA
ncbi:hypothetical protein Shyhy02_11980 [Streptomyces hygroscopicus subsp. hygroscopicus]|nr:hypothetical protein Shyhy02_11980 [Streptomyces hygroscopicus subsp. hygroscopicus]